jgi:hypothetical protein
MRILTNSEAMKPRKTLDFQYFPGPLVAVEGLEPPTRGL